ncbi:MAG: cytochrome c3 family protein [Desulfobulbaceae bacterium]|nr:cytochrome c3 family protein [Desulfobulbaceae bacterium]
MSTAIYTLYSSPTMDVIADQPGAASKVCLACHDGTISIDSFGGMSGSISIGGNADVGTNLADDHPVGIDWNHQTAGSACTTCHPIIWVDSVAIMTFPPTPMFNGKVECPSCHDPHNGFDLPHLVRDTMAGSQLCFNCHGDK